MKKLDHKQITDIQQSVPGLEVIECRLAVVSTNYYDPGTTFHKFVEDINEGQIVINEYKAEGYSVNFKIAYLYTIIIN